MTALLTTLLALVIAVHGLLLIVGGPRCINRMYRLLWNPVFRVPARYPRGVLNLLLILAAEMVRFVFNRPRR